MGRLGPVSRNAMYVINYGRAALLFATVMRVITRQERSATYGHRPATALMKDGAPPPNR